MCHLRNRIFCLGLFGGTNIGLQQVLAKEKAGFFRMHSPVGDPFYLLSQLAAAHHHHGVCYFQQMAALDALDIWFSAYMTSGR